MTKIKPKIALGSAVVALLVSAPLKAYGDMSRVEFAGQAPLKAHGDAPLIEDIARQHLDCKKLYSATAARSDAANTLKKGDHLLYGGFAAESGAVFPVGMNGCSISGKYKAELTSSFYQSRYAIFLGNNYLECARLGDAYMNAYNKYKYSIMKKIDKFVHCDMAK